MPADVSGGSPDTAAAQEYPELAPGNIPELMKISDQQALAYVTQLLEHLISLHEAKFISHSGARRPSFEEAISLANGKVRKLLPSRNFTDGSGARDDPARSEHESKEPEAEAGTSTTEGSNDMEHAVESYRQFWLKEIPPITIGDYLQRFHRYCKSSAATYLATGKLMYMVSVDRQIIPLTAHNVYRLFCAAFMVAVKFIEDNMYPMSRYATTAGLKKADLARLEVSFLLLANFDVKVDRASLQHALKAWADLNSTNTIDESPKASVPSAAPPISAA